MNYQTMMKALLTSINQSLPMVEENYEHVAREYDLEFHAYMDDKEDAPSKHVLFHRPCFNSILSAVKKLRDKKNDQPYFVEGMQLISHVEDHCLQLARPDEHRLSFAQAATNRAIWQGANGLVAMAFALRPKSTDWMNVHDSWRKGVQSACTAIGVLRVRRNHPDELLFSNPDADMHPLEFADKLMSYQAETTEIINGLFKA